MAKNYFTTLRKSYVTGTLLTTVLSNLMVFGQPVHQMLMHLDHLEATAPNTKKHKTYSTVSKKTDFSPSYTFYAEEERGTIGKLSSSDRENPRDNFFTIHIPDSLDLEKYQAILAYDLYGLAQASHTTKSINNFPAFGGKILEKNGTWSWVKEHVPVNYLHPGANELFFTRRADKNYQYQIKNISLQLIEKDGKAVHLTEKTLMNYKGDISLSGMVADAKIDSIEAAGERFPVTNGMFEGLLKNIPPNTKEIEVTYQTSGGQKHRVAFPVRYQDRSVTLLAPIKNASTNNSANFPVSSLQAAVRSFYAVGLGMDKKYQKQLPEGKIDVKGLHFKDLKLLPNELTNVTQGEFLGYRIEKNTLADSIPVQLYLQYDPEKIPDGYTARDIKTFYYDRQQRNWRPLRVDSLDVKNNRVVSTLVSPDTDYINGIIKVPENPETASFVPTAMNDIKFADPAAGVVGIPPPSPNNMGSVSTRFPIKLPAGRNGMQPSLAVSYSSEAGNGWMGMGWNIHIPAISLNTKWGVPTFGANETEIYSLNGEDLVLKNGAEYTNPHRDGGISRVTDRTFYLRKEGSYLKITRHGSNPTNYWWEVTDKQGNKSFYGGHTGSGLHNNAVLKDGEGNISHWALYRQVDPYGNYVEYEYVKTAVSATNGAQSTIDGTEFHIKYINYTLRGTSNSNYYQIAFNSISTRPDVMVNARNGFLQLTKDRLDEIVISLKKGTNTQLIRSYQFEYLDGQDSPFGKSRLSKISEHDTDGDLFYSNTMAYYDEVNTAALIGQNQAWGGQNDPVSSALGDIAPGGFGIPNGSALGTSVSDGFSTGLRGSIGIGNNFISVSTTIGGSFNYSQSTQDTRIGFLDINGDGLPDKVHSNNSGVYYRPNTGTDFGNLVQISGIDRLGKTKSRTSGGGFDANIGGMLGVGASGSTTKGETDYYFTDFNGDGLPDMVGGNRIKFNTTAPNADYTWREFGNGAGNSENPITSGSMDPSLINDLELETLDELQAQHPQFDHVNVWRAPYTGTVSITGQAELLHKNACENTSEPNTFRLTVERTPATQDSLTQLVGAAVPMNNLGVLSINRTATVTKGDLFFFRVHNNQYGCGGTVEWNPKISYTSGFWNTTDEHGKAFRQFDAEQDYVMNNGDSWSPHPDDASISVNFNLDAQDFSAYQFSDQVRFIIEKIRVTYDSNGQQIGDPLMMNKWVRTYQPVTGNFTGIDSINTGVNTSGGTYQYLFRCYAESDSNVQWDDIHWQPYFSGAASNTQYPPVSYTTYDDNANQSAYWWNEGSFPTPSISSTIPHDNAKPMLRLQHTMFSLDYSSFLNALGDGNAEIPPVKINWVVKEKTSGTAKVLYKRSFYMHRLNPKLTGGWNYKFTRGATVNSTEIDPSVNPADSVYFRFNFSKEKVLQLKNASSRIYSAFYVDNHRFADDNLADISLALHPDEQLNYTFAVQNRNSPFMAVNPTLFGLTYRSWGQFLYNGGRKPIYDNEHTMVGTQSLSGRIDLTVFENAPQDQAGLDDLENDINNADPETTTMGDATVYYTSYKQDNEHQKYQNTSLVEAVYGFDSNNRLTATTGRFAEGDLYALYINPQDLIDGSNTTTFFGLKQRTKSKGSAKSGTLGFGTGTESKSGTDVLNQYLDLNGDRYPDIVTKGHLQYSRMQGGLSGTTKLNDFVSGSKGKDETHGVTIAGIMPNSTESANNTASDNKTITNVSSGINDSEGESYDSRQWADMNGDGLPDQVTITTNDVRVRLNNGYGFGDEIVWGSGGGNLLTSTRSSGSGGGSINFGASFAAGFGAAESTANTAVALIDANGDGLTDLVRDNGSAYLNTGIGFSGQATPFFNAAIGENYSLSGNMFGSYSYGFPLFSIFGLTVKAVLTATLGTNASFNETRTMVGDINGDGLPDVLHKENQNGSVNANLNRTGKTGLLRKVNLPLGGHWTVDYAEMGNTYHMPQHKWVMGEVVVNDGFAGDNAFDEADSKSLTTFAYENGHYDRRDRGFYGFESVTSEQRDPGNATGDPYRYTVKKYHNQNYYFKGMLKEAATYKGGTDELLSNTQHFYNLQSAGAAFISEINTGLDDPYINPTVGDLDRTRAFPALVKSISTTYEGGQSLSLVQEFTKYDAYGNLTEYNNNGSGSGDAYQTKIIYGNINFRGLPTRIDVYSEGTLMRRRTAAYNAKGSIIMITTQLGNGETNRVRPVYDGYGNRIQVRFLDNLNSSGNYFAQNITYDPVLHTYPVGFSDSFSQTSSAVYDYLFGVPVLVTDMNNNKMRTRIDDRGRVVEVTGPYELNLPNGNDWTIRNEYEGEGSVAGRISSLPSGSHTIDAQHGFLAGSSDHQHHAATRHAVQGAAGGQLLTISIVDGLGQAIQLKKTHFTNNLLKWMVSGYEAKDAFGRGIKSYLPKNQSNTNNTLSTAATSYYAQSPGSFPDPLEITYDHRDRKLSVTQPGETDQTTFEYGIDQAMFKTSITNELNQTQAIYTDTRGRQRKTVQNGQITTEFYYNAVDDLVKVRNTEGYDTKYTYDLAGRRTQEMHPDRGLTTYTYNNIGKLVEKQTANLMQDTPGTIEYSYNYHRLTKIKYPNRPENNVEYVYGTTPGTKGKVIQQKDATGMQWFSYGKLGELTISARAVAVAGRTSYWFTTEWEYDSWNRIQKITYPDDEEVTYTYDPAGQLNAIGNTIPNVPAAVDMVTNIRYNPYGERRRIDYGNGTYTTYAYDTRRRLSSLHHFFNGHDLQKQYTYDPLSNVTQIATLNNANILPTGGELAGPTLHHYEYDDYNRLIRADGWYIGPNDRTPDLLKQVYSLNMRYDESHNILQKKQDHRQGKVTTLGGNMTNIETMENTAYTLDYEGYASGNFTSGSYSYVQPHAPRTITQYPKNFSSVPAPEDPAYVLVKKQLLEYDANGNLTAVKQELSDPSDPLGNTKLTLRENIWDEENRLRAVDLNPEAPDNQPEVAAYTYDAAGERIVKYLPGRLDAYYSAKAAGSADRMEAIIYPSPLLTVKTKPLPNGIDVEVMDRVSITTYTKHYYMGTERIGSALGTMKHLGVLCEWNFPGDPELVIEVDEKVQQAQNVLANDYITFGKIATLPAPFLYGGNYANCRVKGYDPDNYHPYWYHPDHLGSSNYITNLDGNINQHMEYLPFGETLVEEHLNSYNSPYKFNAKEFDAETGWYYYGARYYSQKYNLMLSVDPASDLYPSFSPYAYTLQNPVRYTDPTGMVVEENPIYDKKGNFLGTDDKGLQGEAIVMNKSDFKQGMSHEDAMSKGTTLDNSCATNCSDDVFNKISEHRAGLPSRPDWDGKLTLNEANEWYQNGGGKSLYVDADKIDLSPVYKGDLLSGESKYVNFLDPRTLNTGTGLIYGTIKLTNNKGRIQLGGKGGFLDTYNFEMQKGRPFRNAATMFGKLNAGEGTSFDILNYGVGKLSPKPSSNRRYIPGDSYKW